MSPAPHADRDHSESPDTIRAAARLCDDDGTVRSGAMHHGQDYECTGSAHFDGISIECTNPVHADRDHSEAPKTDILTAARREAERLTEAIYRQEAAIDRARMERAQAEDAETAATERAEAAEAERDRARSLAATLEARLAQVEAQGGGLIKDRTEWGIQRPAPYEGVIHDELFTEGSAKRTRDNIAASHEGEWHVVKRSRYVTEWESA